LEPLVIQASKSTPFVHLDCQTGVFEIKGESYPENAAKFFGPIFSWLKQYLSGPETSEVRVDIELSYFNSSSSKALMNLFEMLEEKASAGTRVTVNWLYNSENETALEAGEEFQEELSSVVFNIVTISED
jgi:hypothetical protein